MTTVTIPVSAIDQMIASLETFKMALMVAKSGGDVSQVAAMASMFTSAVGAVVEKPTKTKKTKRKNKPRGPSAHCLFLKAKSAELSINYKQAMVHPDVKAEWKEGTSALVQKCKAESIELNKKFVTTKESDVSDGEAEAKIVPKKTLPKVGKREQLRKQLRDEIIAITAQVGEARQSEQWMEEYERKPLSEMNTTELRAELKEWHTAVEEQSDDQQIDEITDELDTMEIAISA